VRAVVGVTIVLVLLAGLSAVAIGRRRGDGAADGIGGMLLGLALLAALVLAVLVVVLWPD
jgi:hypothetical protein